MQKGIIMEIHDRHWIVLTSGGEFLQVPKTNQSSQIGEEVSFQVVRQSSRRTWISIASTAVAAMLGFFFFFPQLFVGQPHAETYVYVDVNPSLAIGLDHEGEVVEVRPLNKSAGKLVNQIKDLNGQSADQAVVNILDEAKKQGMLKQKDRVVLTGIKEEKTSATTINKLQNVIVESSKKQNLDLSVNKLEMPEKVQSKAEETGLSPAKYAAWLVAKKEGQDISVKEIEEKSLTELAKDIKPVSDLLEKPLTEKEWDQIIQVEEPENKDQPSEPTQNELEDPEQTDDTSEDPTTTEPEDPDEDQTTTPDGQLPSPNPDGNSNNDSKSEGGTGTTLGQSGSETKNPTP
ncbi:anti-sigma factor domain-containing protein [Hazenella coriacea]|uniref:Anti-sigma factor-like protein n=1 Tax=Hazenella coriacea TaxID=1179467 RepID=A0A4R3LEU1_9BACL|nr:anti-sigma factor domain-containing protein [Hazenella coriacea]TCS95976.1 anti-sigma factor-like protein [Hazenella coriacea]